LTSGTPVAERGSLVEVPMTSTSFLVTLLLLVPAVPAAVRAEPLALTVDLEIEEKEAGGPQGSVRLTAALAGDHGCASLDTRRGAVDYEAKVCRAQPDPPGGVLLDFEVTRAAHGAQASSTQRFKVGQRLALGKRALLGRIAHSDGATTVLSATVR
jgi:hypothetical protein